MKDVIVGTAGHIDHGKTTLLKALTGIDTDRLKEEKRRGISIDIGFAHNELHGYRIGFIDVPGHEKFVKNMLAGIGGIELVILVVAADESVMPQTVEHFQICRLLEISHGIIVITKKNLVESEMLELVQEEVRDLVRGSALENAPIVGVDSVSGDGLDVLQTALLQEIEKAEQDRLTRQESRHLFRMPIDRVFTIRGFGTVVTGTPYSGELRKGENVSIHPLGREAKIRGIEIFSQPAAAAHAGQRAALNLTGVNKDELERGMVVTTAGAFQPSFILDAVVQVLSNAPRALKSRSVVRFHHGSGEVIGRLHPLEGTELAPGHSALAQIRLEKPVLCCPRDHFVLRRYSPITTIGGGVVLDGSAQKHGRKELNRLVLELKALWSLLQGRDPNWSLAFVTHFVRDAGLLGLSLPGLAFRTGFREDFLRDLLQSSQSITLVPQEPLLAVSSSELDQLKGRLLRTLTEFHAKKSLASGIPREELKEKILSKGSSAYFQFVLNSLERERKVALMDGLVALYGQRTELTEDQEAIKGQLLRRFARQPLQPPALEDLLKELPYATDEIRKVFYFLLNAGELVRITEGIMVPRDQADFLKRRVKESFPQGRSFGVPEFKDLFKITRKYAIPFLEYLDRERVTRRIGDKRVVL